METPSDHQLAETLRSKANELEIQVADMEDQIAKLKSKVITFRATADELDGDSVPVKTMSQATFDGDPVTIEMIREYLNKKGGRIVHLAKHFQRPQDEIRKLIYEDDSGVKVEKRGWLKLK